MLLETTARAIEAFRERRRLLRLECGVQHYPWGDPDAIPAILGKENLASRPFAELWAGAHPDLPAIALIDGVRAPLDQLIAEAPVEVLGERVAKRFGSELPFLLKILAAAKPLSIQAHPNDAQARAGFERENRAGLPLNAPTRNYHDAHHKPELLVALSDFYTLRGFRPVDEIAETLASTPELAQLSAYFRAQGGRLPDLYAHVMHLDTAAVNALLSPLVERLRREDRHQPFGPDTCPHWLLRADATFSVEGRRDPGLFSVLFLNLVHLRPGQAVYLPSGELHAYLRGVGVELMANSNNVLRGGLTSKHVDVDELLRTLSFRAASAEVLEGHPSPDHTGLVIYTTPSSEFVLSRLELPEGEEFLCRASGPLLALLTNGRVSALQPDLAPEEARAGEALLAPAGLALRLRAEADTVVWLTRVPEDGR